MSKDFQEFPKALYRNGEHAAVADKEAEDALRKDGYTDWHSDQKAIKAAEKKAK